MTILTIRTDKPEAEIGLYEDERQLAYETWLAHRQLAETLHRKIGTLLRAEGKQWSDLEGIVCFQGPGSFTGLRIGITVGNALAYSYGLPIVATQEPRWLETGVERLIKGKTDTHAMPFYGAEAHITIQKK
jgi:tRNA threonylcarbamoyladenosine biosynthesis protein TsaB